MEILKKSFSVMVLPMKHKEAALSLSARTLSRSTPTHFLLGIPTGPNHSFLTRPLFE